MKALTYNNIILTVIAVCLSVMVLREVEIIPVAIASNNEKDAIERIQSSVVDVRIVGYDYYSPIPVNIKDVNYSGGIPVDVKNSYIYTRDY